MNCPKKYNKVGKQCGDKYHAFIVEVVSTGLSLSVLGHRQDIIRFIHGSYHTDMIFFKMRNKGVWCICKSTIEIIIIFLY